MPIGETFQTLKRVSCRSLTCLLLQVLIHAGTGGVGLSAIQVAKAMGAQVAATAGSTSKRRLLREMGVSEVVGSRDTEFVSTLSSKGKTCHVFLSKGVMGSELPSSEC